MEGPLKFKQVLRGQGGGVVEGDEGREIRLKDFPYRV